MVRPQSCRVIYYFDTPALGKRHQSFGRVTNHNLILLICGRLSYKAGERPFRFEVTWTTHNEYKDMVSTTWSNSKNNVMHGLNEVRRDSINFNKNTFKNIF